MRVKFVLSHEKTGFLVGNLLYAPDRDTPCASSAIYELTETDGTGTLIYIDDKKYYYRYIGDLNTLLPGEQIVRENIRSSSYDPGSGTGKTRTGWVDKHVGADGCRVEEDPIIRIQKKLGG